MKIRYGPAAVIGNEPRNEPLIRLQTDREGAGSRKIRESEDLPLKFTFEVMANPQATSRLRIFVFWRSCSKGNIMKAAVLLEPGKLICRETPTPECPPKGVLVEIQACGICSADVKMVTNGHRALTYPRILGHEIAGVVVEAKDHRWKPGDRVQVAPGHKWHFKINNGGAR